MALSDADTQVLIDNLFERLEAAEQPSTVNLVTHSLRLHITSKHDAGLPLSDREQGLVDALGFIRNRRRGPAPTTVLLLVVLLAGVAYALWRFVL